MYNNKLVACVKTNGRILREDKDTVTLPFGSEYSVLIKNLNAVRIQIKVSVDGQDATEGTHLIVGPNSSLELERFIRNGNLSAGNKFRFIERTGEIEEHRGIGVDDGIVRVESWAEVVPVFVPMPTIHYQPPWNQWPYERRRERRWDGRLGGVLRSSGISGSSSNRSTPTASGSNFVGAMQNQATYTQNSLQSTSENMDGTMNDAGITVPGSESHQQFHSTMGFPVENQSRVIVLRLRGQVAGQLATQPITVEYRPQCTSCGRKNKATNRFCSQCGTALVII